MKTTFVNLLQSASAKGHMAIWSRVVCYSGIVGMNI